MDLIGLVSLFFFVLILILHTSEIFCKTEIKVKENSLQ
jgi:hypothetical protein